MSKKQPYPDATQANPTSGPSEVAVELIDAPPAAANGRIIIEDLGIHIDRNGRWYYHGSAIERKELVCLFASALTRDRDGGYWLVTATEMGRISVEDAPLVAVESFIAGEGREGVISLRLNTDEIVTIDAGHPLCVQINPETGEPSPCVMLPRGLAAKLTRSVYYELVDGGMTEELEQGSAFGVWSAGRFFPLGSLDDQT